MDSGQQGETGKANGGTVGAGGIGTESVAMPMAAVKKPNILWPAGLAPVPVPLLQRPQPTDALPACDYLAVTWTVAVEGSSLRVEGARNAEGETRNAKRQRLIATQRSAARGQCEGNSGVPRAACQILATSIRRSVSLIW